jgi:hypothetical protein
MRFISSLWSVGSISEILASLGLIGVDAAGSVGDVVSGEDKTFDLTGVNAEGLVGDVLSGIELEGNTGTGSVGDFFETDISFDLTGVTGTGIVNTAFLRPVWSLINNASNGPPRG